MNLYKGKIIRVIDGDTYEAIINIGFGVKQLFRIRLAGVDTPELKTDKGKKVKEEISKLLTDKDVIAKEFPKADKFGRALAYIELDGKDITDLILENDWGKEYYGGKKIKAMSRQPMILEEIQLA